MLSKSQYKQFYDTVSGQIGWDFSSLQITTEGEGWELYEEVQYIAEPTHFLLDIGTGGGEKALKLTSSVSLVVGIDISEGMIDTANSNKKQEKITNARFCVMDAESIQFPNGFFDVISCRHSDFNPQEVYRLLSPDGHFLTQQVSEGDKKNLAEHFGRGQNENPDGTLKEKYVDELTEAGFPDVKVQEYNATEYYHRPEDLIFLLKHTPIIPQFGQKEGDFEKLDEFIQNNMTEKGITTNSKRFLITTQK